MKTRALGNTGIQISEIGLGTWGLGGVYHGNISREEAIGTVRAYLDSGGNHIDTAYSYQASEEIIGQAIKGYDRDSMIITSKTYMGSSRREDFPKIRKQLEVSLRGLGVDYVDVYMIHGTPGDPDHLNALCDEFEKLRDEGKFRVLGASIPGPVVNDERLERTRNAIRTGRIQAIQLNYSIARQKLGEAFEEAAGKGVGIITRWVLESGLLTGVYPPGHEFIWPDTKARYKPEERDGMLRMAVDLKEKLPEGYENFAQLAIAFALANKNISGVILGAMNSDEVERNNRVDSLPPLPEELLRELKEKYGPLNDSFNPTGDFEHVPGRQGANLK